MRNGPSLVIRGTIIGSLVVALLGWFLAKHIEILPIAEVAYAASPTQVSEQPAPAENCQVSVSYPQGYCSGATSSRHLPHKLSCPPI